MSSADSAERVFAFDVPVSPGVTSASPTTTAFSMPSVVVVGIEIVIPDGVNGLAGIALAMGGQRVIPENAGSWIVRNDDVVRWSIDGYPNTGAWQAITYNTDVFSHTFHVVFLCRVTLSPSDLSPVVVPIPITA